MDQMIRIGMDTSKHVFQLHGVNAAEEPVLRKKLRRQDLITFFEKLPPTVIGIEACGGSHHWARLLQALGHQVKMIAPQLVKPYVKRGKNDAADAEAICMRGHEPAEHAFCAVQNGGAAGGPDAGGLARPADPPAHPTD